MAMGRKQVVFAAVLALACAFSVLTAGIFSGPAYAYPAGWTSDLYIGSTAKQSVDVAFWGDTILVVWKDNAGHVICKRSANGGQAWSYPSSFSGGRADKSTSECFDPQVVMYGSIAFIGYKTRNEPHDTWAGFPNNVDYVVLKRSDDGGVTWKNLDPETHKSRGVWYAITPQDRSVNNFDLDRCNIMEPFLLAYEENNGGNKVKAGWFHNVGVMTAGGSNAGMQIPVQAPDRAVICPAIAGAGANEYYVSFVERNWESSPGELVVVARFLEGQGWSDWNTYPQGKKAVPMDGYKGHGSLRDTDISCISSGQMRAVWDDTSSGRNEAKLRVLDTNQVQGLSTLRTVDHTPFTKTCRGRDLRVYRGQNSGDGRRYLRDAASDTVIMDLGSVSQESFNTFNIERDGRAGSRTYLVGTRQSDGKIYFKKTDEVAPTCDPIKISGKAPATVPTYFKSSFQLSLANVKDADWNLTGADIKGKFNNGVASAAFKYAPKSNSGKWTTLKTVSATGAAGLAWAATVSVPGLGDGRYYFKGTITDTAGNSSDAARSGEIVVDTNPPNTAINRAGTGGDNGWHKSDVTVTLTPVDAGGFDYTTYQIKNNASGAAGEWIKYGGPFVIAEGQWAVSYYSTDKAGNVETTKTMDINIDKTPPSAAVLTPTKDAIQTGFESNQQADVSGMGSDSGSGLASETIFLNGSVLGNKKTSGFGKPITARWNVSRAKPGNYEIKVSVRDRAGNVGTAIKFVNLDNFCKDWYLAEGNTLPDFKEYLCIVNPGDKDAKVRLDFMLEDGNVITPDRVTIAAHSRATYRVTQFVPEGHSGVSTRVHCDNQAIVVERPMYFHYKAADPTRNWKGGHIGRGINTLQKQAYFAEGTTRDNPAEGQFDTWLTMLNPGAQTADVSITYMLGDGSNINKSYEVGPHSRKTVSVNQDVGPGKDVSTKIVSNVPLACERPQYQDYRGFAVDGHNAVGAPSPMKSWHFAEGTTKHGFEEWLTIQNPGDIAANVKFTYMNGESKVTTAVRVVPRRSRATVKVVEDVGDAQDISATVESDQPIVAERPMYFNYGGSCDGATNAMGEVSASRTFYIAEGCTLAEYQTYYCIQNANESDARVRVTYMLGDGAQVKRDYTVRARSRLTVNVNDPYSGVGPGQNISAKVTSSVPVTIERPMYFNSNGYVGGHVGSAYGID